MGTGLQVFPAYQRSDSQVCRRHDNAAPSLRCIPDGHQLGDLVIEFGNMCRSYLADIGGVPPERYARPSISIEIGPIFAVNEIVRLK